MRQGSVSWFAHHELRLARRDALIMLQGGRKGRLRWAILGILIVSVVLHLVAYSVISPTLDELREPDKATLLMVTGSAALAWALMLSQALESVTRGFYARGDLDLILSSPTSSGRLFLVRIGAIAATTAAMATVLLGPFIDVAAVLGGPRYLGAYGVLAAMAALATAVAVVMASVLFRLCGPRRTRLIAQILAAVIGAGFVITIQAIAIMSYGSLSRLQMFQSPAWVAAAPDAQSPVWWPVRAALGDGRALVPVLGIAALALVAAALATAGTFARTASAVAASTHGARVRGGNRTFRLRSRGQTLRWKEWTLLARDPWLVSQTLMQVLYLVPPALLLWRNFGSAAGFLVLVPVIVMAAGQLAGGLAWLAISGEDAPEMIATAPLPQAAVLRAKIEAVMIAVALPVVPLAIAMAFGSPRAAWVTALGAGVAAAAACAVQFYFRAQAKRSNFRRRQTSSRFATLAEALVSISIAGAAALTAAGTWLALVPFSIAAGILLAARQVSASRA